MAGEPAQRRQKRTPPEDPLLLSEILQESPPVALIKDDEVSDDPNGGGVVDRFGTSEIAARLTQIIQRIDPPYTVSLSGSWGVGKTWVAKRLKSMLAPSSVPVVEVDLWTEDIDQLRRSLAVEVAARLSGETDESKLDKKRDQEAKKLDLELRRPEAEPTAPRLTARGLRSKWAIGTAVVALLLFGLMWVALAQPTPPSGESPAPWISPVISAVVVAMIWLVLQSGLVLSVHQPASSLPPIREAVALRNKFRDLVTSHPDRKVLVVLDNLDRLTGEDAVTVLGEIRSFVELQKSRCVFLVPLDRSALERHLIRSMGGDDQAARDYLDKFFNLDLVLTNPAPADLRESILGLLAELFVSVPRSALASVAEIVSFAAAGSPRAAKRIANGTYARAYLMPTGARNRITLLDVAFVEGLLARFPAVVPQLEVEMERSLRRIDRVRNTSNLEIRLTNLLDLIGDRSEPPADESEAKAWGYDRWRKVHRLGDFLLATRSVAPTADVVRTVLTARLDRQLGKLADPQAAAIALRSGDPKALGTALAGLTGDDRHDALAALLDLVRTDLSERWRLGARAGLNALAPLSADDPSIARTLRSYAAEYLVDAVPDDFRSLEAETVRALFLSEAGGVPYRTTIADRAVAALTPSPASRLPAQPAVRSVAALADALRGRRLEETKAALAGLNDDELAPLYEEWPGYSLLPGPISNVYVTRLASFDPAGELPPHEIAAERLLFAQERAEWEGSSLLDPVYERLSAVLASGTVPVEAMPLLERLVDLTKLLPPHTQLDTLAQRLAAYATGGRRSVELSLKIPTGPSVLESVVTQQMNAMSADDFLVLATSHKQRLAEIGVKAAEMATARWAAGQGREYLTVALTSDEPGHLDPVFAALKSVVDPGIHANLVAGLAEHCVAHDMRDGAARLISDISSRVNTFGPTAVALLAPEVSKVQELASPDPLIDAMRTQIKAMSREEIGASTSAARGFVDNDVDGSDALAVEVAKHGAAHGVVDLDNLNWLLEQPGVEGDDVIMGFVGAIKTEVHDTVHAALTSLNRNRRKRGDIGKALVERGASEPVGSRLPWLTDALPSSVPSRRRGASEHAQYEDALNRAVEGDPTTEDVVRQLRRRV